MTNHFVSEMAGGAAAFRVFFLSRRSSNAFGPAHWCDSCKSARREIGFIHDASIGEDVGVSKNRGILPPKWMVKIMVPNPMNKWMIWGVVFQNPLFLVGSTPMFFLNNSGLPTPVMLLSGLRIRLCYGFGGLFWWVRP